MTFEGSRIPATGEMTVRLRNRQTDATQQRRSEVFFQPEGDPT